jgi:hypothetical protein
VFDVLNTSCSLLTEPARICARQKDQDAVPPRLGGGLEYPRARYGTCFTSILPVTNLTSGLKDGYNIYVYPGAGTVDGDRGDHIIISPAYNITDEDIDFIVDRLGKLIIDFFEGLKPSLE